MTDKELKKLNRRELLQILLDQAKETERLKGELTAAGERAREMDETFQRLRDRLDDKDAKLREMDEIYDRLRSRLNVKDAQIRKLSTIIRAAQKGRKFKFDEADFLAKTDPQPDDIPKPAAREDAPADWDEEGPAVPEAVADEDVLPGEELPAQPEDFPKKKSEKKKKKPDKKSEKKKKKSDKKKSEGFLQKFNDFATNF